MTLHIQRALRGGETLDSLASRLALKVYAHPTLPLVGLKYDQLDSPRMDPIVRECRGLVLERDTWAVVAKPFTRFYNVDEHPEETRGFDWRSVSAREKEDGSLAILYHYRGAWHLNTSGSFGLGEVVKDGPTWRELFWRTAPFADEALSALEDTTLLFELCAPENKVVRRYWPGRAFLIGGMRRSVTFPTGEEAWLDLDEDTLDELANELGCPRPQGWIVASLDDVRMTLRERVADDDDFEGFVLRDKHDVRLKVKSPEYLALAHMKDNGNLYRDDRLVPWALREDPFELLKHFPEAEDRLREVTRKVWDARGRLAALWASNRHVAEQKAFALRVKDDRLSGHLFQARKKHGPGLGPLAELLAGFDGDHERVAKVIA